MPVDLSVFKYWMEKEKNIAEKPAGRPAFNENAAHYVRQLVSGKARAEKEVVKQVLSEIVARETISGNIRAGIEADMLDCDNLLHEIHSITEGQYLIDKDSLRFSARRTTIEMKLLDLKSAKREEAVNAWKDMATLRRYLLFALKDYWNASRREALVRLGA